MELSPIINGLLDYLGEQPTRGAAQNMTTLHRQGQVAQDWLLTDYLSRWLKLIGELVDCDYPVAKRFRVQLRAIARLTEYLDPKSPESDLLTELRSVEATLQSTLRVMAMLPDERGMQWGIWARDVPLSIAEGFSETDFLSPLICQGIAPCCMFSAFLVSQVVTDDGVAEEISAEMFAEKPRALIEIMRAMPDSPEA